MAAIIQQIAPIVNDAYKDAIGENVQLSVLDTSDFVSMGKNLGNGETMDSAAMYESFFASLANRLVKTIYAIRVYRARTRGILRDETEWGAFKQKVHYDVVDATNNPAFTIPDRSGQDPSYTQVSPYDVSTTIKIKPLLFGGQGTWSIEIVRPIAQIMTAFTNAAEMASFIDGIYTYIENSMQLEVEAVENAAANTGIATAVLNGKARNLLMEYNALDTTTTRVSAAECMSNPGFLRYAAKEIRMVTKYMGRMSRRFNAGNMPKFTPEDRLVVEMLEDFVSSSEVYMQSDTYHRELVELPRYTPIEFWQGSGVDFDFADIGAIKIQHDNFVSTDNQTGTVKVNGIIAFLHDVDAIAANFGEAYDWEQPNVRQRVVNVGRQMRKGFGVDPNENMFVFFVSDSETIEDVTMAGMTEGSLWDVSLSDIQTGITVTTNKIAGNTITGTSKWLSGSNAITDVWGPGNFIALQLSAEDWSIYDSVKIGITPTQGAGYQEILTDPDKQALLKIADKDKQVIKIITKTGFLTEVQTYSLAGLTMGTQA